MTRFWWVRHGPTHAKGMVGWTDLPADLSDHSRIERLSRSLPRDAPVVSSDLQRAAATADALAACRTGLGQVPELREINFGDWEMQTFDQIQAENPERIRAFYEYPGDVRAPLGETWNETRVRVNAAVDRILIGGIGTDVIIVAHFGTILTQVQRALKISSYDAFGHRIDNLSVTEIIFDGGWSAGRINHVP